jgi:hypothetical protein
VYLCRVCAERHFRPDEWPTDDQLFALKRVAKTLMPVDIDELIVYAKYLKAKRKGR